jgi:hypothetical protein
MTATTTMTPDTKTARPEGAIQIVIMLAIGGAAGAASFTHVHDVAAAHGQGGWLAWADAVVLELMSIASGLEMRRRKRQHKAVLFPAAVLVCAVALSISAQVVEAERSVIGWIAAALPALGFLVMVKIALGRAAPIQRDPMSIELAGDEGGNAVDISTAVPADGHRPRRDLSDGDDHDPFVDPTVDQRGPRPESSGPSGTGFASESVAGDADGADVAALLPAAREARDMVVGGGRALTRDTLAEQLRKNGHPMRNARVSLLLTTLRAERGSDSGG